MEHAQTRLQEKVRSDGEADSEDAGAEPDPALGWTSTLASVLGGIFGGDVQPALNGKQPIGRVNVNFREAWDRFQSSSEIEIPSGDNELMDELVSALTVAKDEWDGGVTVSIDRLEIADDLPAFDMRVSHGGQALPDARVFLCNRTTQGGGLKRQLDKVLTSMAGKPCFMLRATDFPPNRKNQTAQAFRKFRDGGGRQLLVPIPEWERMMTVREFHAHHRADPGFMAWFESTKMLSNLITVIQLLRLDLLGRTLPRAAKVAMEGDAVLSEPPASAKRKAPVQLRRSATIDPAAPIVPSRPLPTRLGRTRSRAVGRLTTTICRCRSSSMKTVRFQHSGRPSKRQSRPARALEYGCSKAPRRGAWWLGLG